MVDFNNEATVSQSATDIMRILVLEKREYLLASVKTYYKYKYLGSEPDLSTIKSALQDLYLELFGSFERHFKKGELKTLEENIESEEFEDNLRATKTLILLLDKFKLTRLDNKRQYDSSRPSEEDEEKNL